MFRIIVAILAIAIVISGCSSETGDPESTINPGLKELPTSIPTEPFVEPTAVEEVVGDDSETPVADETAEATATAAEAEEVPSSQGEQGSLPQRSDVSGLALYCWQNPDYCVGKGDPNAPVIMVEISDYGCGYCRNFNLETAPELDKEYVESGDLYWIVLPYALGQERIPSTNSAMCAAEQDAFAAYHHRMFEIFSDTDARTPDGFFRIARELDFDMDSFTECVENEKYRALVEQNIALAAAVGANSTPTFVIGEQALVGNYPLDAFRQWIDAELGR